jgi:hypothetical protein
VEVLQALSKIEVDIMQSTEETNEEDYGTEYYK